MSLCQYKNLFGEPGKGVHSYRIGGIAAVDLGLTILAAFIISFLFKTNFIVTLLVLLLLGIILHRIFCVRTTVDKFLFPC